MRNSFVLHQYSRYTFIISFEIISIYASTASVCRVSVVTIITICHLADLSAPSVGFFWIEFESRLAISASVILISAILTVLVPTLDELMF